jgi:hypothetical protein
MINPIFAVPHVLIYLPPPRINPRKYPPAGQLGRWYHHAYLGFPESGELCRFLLLEIPLLK